MIRFLHLTTLALFGLFFSGTPVKKLSVKDARTKTDVTPTAASDKKESAEAIPWVYERMLSWEDFQGAPKRGTDAVATTNTSLGLAYQIVDGELKYQITCSFSKKKSWGSMKTDYILAHEQAHFDITELYARALHKALSEYSFNRKTYQQDISNIYQTVVKEKEAFQEAYDGETDHSRRKRAQVEWLEKIEQLLTDTEPYEFYP